MNTNDLRPLAVITGGSNGIGYDWPSSSPSTITTC
jgi:hypothetical protein